MAVEQKRGCGYRKVGGLYLVGSGVGEPCDRLPMAIIPCSTCGEEPRFHRAVSKINPLRIFGLHEEQESCADMMPGSYDPICSPSDVAYLMWVGKEYTAMTFGMEARQMGISKRIHQIPKDFTLGFDWVWLAKLQLIPSEGKTLALDSNERGYGAGIFSIFKPTAIEKIITQSQAAAAGSNGEAEAWKEQGITPIVVPDDDPDHNPWSQRQSKAEVE